MCNCQGSADDECWGRRRQLVPAMQGCRFGMSTTGFRDAGTSMTSTRGAGMSVTSTRRAGMSATSTRGAGTSMTTARSVGIPDLGSRILGCRRPLPAVQDVSDHCPQRRDPGFGMPGPVRNFSRKRHSAPRWAPTVVVANRQMPMGRLICGADWTLEDSGRDSALSSTHERTDQLGDLPCFGALVRR